MTRSTVSRSLHDVGLAAWFGGTLANAVALNPASGHASSPADSGQVANTGWNRWTPVNAAAIAMHVAGSVGQLSSNKTRLAAQPGVGTMAVVKTAVTAAALGVTAYSRVLGRQVAAHTDVPVDSATSPAAATPPEVAAAQKQLAVLQWAVPALTGTLVVISSFAGEQQRPASVLRNLLTS
ncbi:MAG: hypothetical protein M3Y44_15260 [Actinomycetota bacterium]|nr:hypothetical protein [Actinomycetota bacterium]